MVRDSRFGRPFLELEMSAELRALATEETKLPASIQLLCISKKKEKKSQTKRSKDDVM